MNFVAENDYHHHFIFEISHHSAGAWHDGGHIEFKHVQTESDSPPGAILSKYHMTIRTTIGKIPNGHFS